MSIYLFWTLTVLLSLVALCFIFPWDLTLFIKIVFSVCMLCITYSGYYLSGASHQLVDYYAAETTEARADHAKIRILLGALRKKEFRLHVRLEENPNDVEAQWSLLNVMGIHAYESHQYEQAIAYWKQALELIPRTSEQVKIRTMIERLVSNAEKK